MINIFLKTEIELWEREEIENSFQDLGVISQKKLPLFGVDAITIVELIIIPLATNVLYDLLKFKILNLLKLYKKRGEKEIRIIVKNQEKTIVIEEKKIKALSSETAIDFENLTEAIKFLETNE